MKPWNPARRSVHETAELALQDGAAAVILVAKIDINVVDAHGPGGDDRAFEKPVRVAFEVIAVLERSRLALINVDREQPRSGFCGHDSPFAPGGESGAAE